VVPPARRRVDRVGRLRRELAPPRTRARWWLSVVTIVAIASAAIAACATRPQSNPYYNPEKSHHRPTGFANSDPQATTPELSFLDQLERNLTGYFRPKGPPKGGYEAFARDWSAPLEREWIRANRTQTAVTWLGHASILLQTDGRNLLMDPVFSERASPLSFMGPPRRVPSPAQVSDLPAIDVVLVSHNHYDHLDRPTILALHRAQPTIQYIVPLGLKAWFINEGITNVAEFDWWDSTDLGTLRIHVTPAQHWSKRTIWDRNESLWCGFMIESRTERPWRFLYTGDTGYSRDFTEIRKRLGMMDFVALPIGAYEPRDFMRTQHINPADAAQIVLDLEARAAFGVHWGTFELTQETFDQPVEDLALARAKLGIAPERFFVMKHGATHRIVR
jgi:N-acyl-phosphatidylethanolamine-hydrolysing phospholipase D